MLPERNSCAQYPVAFMLFPFLKLIFFLNHAFTSVFVSEFAHLVFPVVAFPHSYLPQHCYSHFCSHLSHKAVIRYFRFGIHQVVGWITHCPSPVKWRHIAIDPEHVELAIRLYLVHSILSMRESCLNISATLPLNKEEICMNNHTI